MTESSHPTAPRRARRSLALAAASAAAAMVLAACGGSEPSGAGAAPDNEVEAIEETILDQATAAKTITISAAPAP